MSQGTSQILNWDAPNGKLLRRFVDGLPKDRPITVNVFGSTPLQLRLDPSFLSGDVDIFSSEDLQPYAEAMGISKGQSDPYIEVVQSNVFIASLDWRDRAACEIVGNITIYVAAPIDVLVGKLKRLEQKDLDAYDLVKALTGGPGEQELLKALQQVVDMYRPGFDEENPGGDAISNTRRLWLHLYGHDIDVRREIIGPAVAERRKGYGEDGPDHRSTLQEIAGSYGRPSTPPPVV